MIITNNFFSLFVILRSIIIIIMAPPQSFVIIGHFLLNPPSPLPLCHAKFSKIKFLGNPPSPLRRMMSFMYSPLWFGSEGLLEKKGDGTNQSLTKVPVETPWPECSKYLNIQIYSWIFLAINIHIRTCSPKILWIIFIFVFVED